MLRPACYLIYGVEENSAIVVICVKFCRYAGHDDKSDTYIMILHGTQNV